MFYLFLFLEALIVTILLSNLVLKLFPRLGLMDRPHKYGHKRDPIPYPTGIILFIVFVLHLLFLTKIDSKTIGFIAGLTILLVTNFYDDRRGLHPVLKLFIQFISACVMVATGIGISVISNPLGGSPILLDQWTMSLSLGSFTYSLSILSALFTIFWIILFVNTLNWIDEPGIVSGVSGISFLVIFALSFILSIRTNVGQDEIINAQMVAQLAIVGAGMCIAFVFFDFPPAKMLMGDSGSITLGCIIAVLAIFSGGKIATTFLVLGFPVMDAIMVIGRRIYQKKSPFKGDLGHFHHRLVRIGFSHRKTNLLIYAICIIFGSMALFLGSKEKLFIILFLVLLSIVIEFLVMRKEKKMINGKS